MKKATVHTVPHEAQEKATNAAGDTRQSAQVAEALSGILASTYALYQKSLFYHWNVTGPHFSSLHKLFEEQYEALHAAGDVIAERIRALGFFAPGTLAEFASLSSVKEDEALPREDSRMIVNLLHSHEACSHEARKVKAVAEKASDDVTVDLMIQRMAYHDKAAWMLRAFHVDPTKESTNGNREE